MPALKHFFLFLLLLFPLISCALPQDQTGSNSPVPGKTAGPGGATSNDLWKIKASSQLLYQIDMKKLQMESPTAERLKQMESQGIDTRDLSRQKLFIYVLKELSETEQKELKESGVTVYLSSWIPPVGVFPNGYYTADAPVDMISKLAVKEYVAKLDTAERLMRPESRPQ